MICVIIAGGSGTRLWPLSTPDYPKHLLTLNGDSKSLLQRTYERAAKLASEVYVVSEKGHVEHVKAQLPELSEDHFIVEPARRGTANCIVAALAYLHPRHNDEDPIAFLAADHYIRDNKGFGHSFRIAAEQTVGKQRITLVGVEPSYVATGFGYIQKGEVLDEEAFVYAVQAFTEKPSYDVAKAYVESGDYLWNCGYFVGTNKVFVEAMQRHSPVLFEAFQSLQEASAETYEQTYLSLTSQAIDYALIEKVPDLLVVPASFDWMDLGSFKDLHQAAGGNEHGNSLYGTGVALEEVENSFIHNEEDKPVAVIGLDNIIVVNTPKGLLVARKDLSQKIGEVSKRLTDPNN